MGQGKSHMHMHEEKGIFFDVWVAKVTETQSKKGLILTIEFSLDRALSFKHWNSLDTWVQDLKRRHIQDFKIILG